MRNRRHSLQIPNQFSTITQCTVGVALILLLSGCVGMREQKYNLGANPHTPSFMLNMLAGNSEWTIRAAVAGNPKAPSDLLRKLSSDAQWSVREDVASNRNTPTDVLAKLAKDPSYHVRSSVAHNPNTPLDLLYLLANDSESHVRCMLAYNRNAPPEILAKLAEDKDHDVTEAVAKNPKTPLASKRRAEVSNYAHEQRSAARRREEKQRKIEQASNPSTDPAVLAKLAKYASDDTLIAIAGNPGTPSETLYEMYFKESDAVKKAIEANAVSRQKLVLYIEKHRNNTLGKGSPSGNYTRQSSTPSVSAPAPYVPTPPPPIRYNPPSLNTKTGRMGY